MVRLIKNFVPKDSNEEAKQNLSFFISSRIRAVKYGHNFRLLKTRNISNITNNGGIPFVPADIALNLGFKKLSHRVHREHRGTIDI